MKYEVTRDLDRCGFVCPHCSFRLVLSSPQTKDILEYFQQRTAMRSIQCPECGNSNTYKRNDLKYFAPGGKELSFDPKTVVAKAS